VTLLTFDKSFKCFSATYYLVESSCLRAVPVSWPGSASGIKCSWHSTVLGFNKWAMLDKSPPDPCILLLHTTTLCKIMACISNDVPIYCWLSVAPTHQWTARLFCKLPIISFSALQGPNNYSSFARRISAVTCRSCNQLAAADAPLAQNMYVVFVYLFALW